jgi:hypothetical protein
MIMKTSYLEHAAEYAANHSQRSYSCARPKPVTDTRGQWIAAHQPAYAWLVEQHASGNTFASSLLANLDQYGSLTARQLACVQQSIDRAAPMSVAGEGFSLLLRAFAHARNAGLKYPKVHVGSLRFTLAQDTSKNPGYIYVRADEEYAGKISPAGDFSPAHTTTQAQIQRITDVSRDPFAAAIAHGHATGNCAICSRSLSDPQSVIRGIGPVCAKKFGWM